ncbi:hypothetical protein [Ruegeria sp. Ofav3-42]|uniref:hypothetical protein n=1 Tax=Ruegeria sp. Ofav3-42 TaxID=2917759 RepID=UPI001EF67149|nr:hypothetical protein [Ruegeria sp. Ofav3-42]
MLDDNLLNDLVDEAQKEGRQVNCHTPGSDVLGNVESAAESYQGSFPDLKRVSAGAIV